MPPRLIAAVGILLLIVTIACNGEKINYVGSDCYEGMWKIFHWDNIDVFICA